MDAITKQEAKARTLKLESYDSNKEALNKVVDRLVRLVDQTHETRLGMRIKMTKRRKIAKANAIIDTLPDIDFSQDAINQLRLIDA